MHNNHLSLQETAIYFNLAGDWIVSRSVYIMRKVHKCFMKNDMAEIKI